jgi:PIN domain nuclease of toxin-antitoxin system
MILLDTHVLVWMASEPKQLSRRAHQAIRSTAMIEGAPLITADARIRQTKVVQTIW